MQQLRSTGNTDLAKALISWIKYFPEASHVNGYDDLSDGKVIWGVLGQLNPTHFRGLSPLPGRTTWSVDGWTNLLHIDRRVTEYISDVCNELPFLMKAHLLDLQRASTEGDVVTKGGRKNDQPMYGKTDSLVWLLTFVFLAGVYSEVSNHRVVEIIQSMGDFYAEVLKAEIDRLQALNHTIEHQPAKAEPPAPSIARDPELEREERLIAIVTENKELLHKISGLNGQVEEYKKTHASLKSRIDEAESQLQLRSKVSESQAFAVLKEENERDRDLIAELESKLGQAQDNIEHLEKQIRSLTTDNSDKQELKDEIQLLKAERSELLNSVKVNENLKKKIQSLQEEQRVAEGLKKRLEESLLALEQLEQLQGQYQDLQGKHASAIEILSNSEKELFAQRTTKMHLQHELDSINAKYQQQLETQYRLEEHIQELETRLEEHGGPANLDTLDKEMEQADSEDEQVPEPLTAAPAPAASAPAQLSMVEEKLQKFNTNLQSRLEDLEHDYLGLLEEKLSLERRVQSLMSDQGISRHYQDLIQQVSSLESRIAASETGLKLRDSEIKQLRQTSKQDEGWTELADISRALHESIGRQQVTMENKDRLIERSLDVLAGRPLLPSRHAQTTEVELVRRQLEQLLGASEEGDVAERSEMLATQLGSQISDYSCQVDSLKQVLRSKDDEIRQLRAELEESRRGGAGNEMMQPIDDEERRMLQAQNKLIITAWYRNASAMTQQSVALPSRKGQAAKGWISRMRSVVNSQSVVV